MTFRFGLFIGIFLTLAVAACGSPGADEVAPPDIQIGRDICIECGMIISEQKFAAAYTLDDGTEKLFDDIGGLIKHQRKTGDVIDPERAWVFDMETVEWVDLASAYFVGTRDLVTPMGHGIGAFSDKGRAEAFAAEVDAEVIRWDVVFELPEHDRLIGHHHEGMGGMGGTDNHDHDHDHGEGGCGCGCGKDASSEGGQSG